MRATNIVRNETVIKPSKTGLENEPVDVPSGRNIMLDIKPNDTNAAIGAMIESTVTIKEGFLFKAVEANLLDAIIQIKFGVISNALPNA